MALSEAVLKRIKSNIASGKVTVNTAPQKVAGATPATTQTSPSAVRQRLAAKGIMPDAGVRNTAYYSRPDVDGGMESAHKTIQNLSPLLTTKKKAFETAQENLKGAEESVSFWADKAQKLANSYSEQPQEFIATLYEKAYSRYEQAYQAYGTALGVYNTAYTDYKPVEERYNNAVTEYQGYSDQLAQWKSTVRDAESVEAELTALQKQITEQEKQEMPGNVAAFMGDLAVNTMIGGTGLMPVNQKQRQTSPEMQALLDKQTLLLEELDWSRQFAQEAEDEKWRNTARDAQTVKQELADLEVQIHNQKVRDFRTAKPEQAHYGAALSAPQGQLGTSAQLQGLLDHKALLEEELNWSLRNRYAALANNEDFGEKSKYVSTANGRERKGSDGTWENIGFDDVMYDTINGNKDAIGRQEENSSKTSRRPVLEGSSWRNQLEEDEISLFNYLYATEGKEQAYEYLDWLKPELNKRNREKNEERARQYAQEHPFLSSVETVFTLPQKSLGYLEQFADYAIDGKIDENAEYNTASHRSGAIRDQVSESIKASGKWGEVGSFAYQTAMSMGDFLMSTAVSGGNSAVAMAIMGTGAAADTTIAAKDRGLSDGQAFALGTVAGLAEAVTEKVSLDTLLDASLLRDGTLKYILKNMLAEGSEEVASSLINLTADILISQEKSEWQAAVDAYMRSGMSESQAFGQAFSDQMATLGLDFLGGAISGGVMGGGNATIYSIGNRGAKQKGDAAQDAELPAEPEEPKTFGEEMTRQIINNWSDNPEPKVTVLPEANVGEEVVRSAQRIAKATGRDIVFYSEYATAKGMQHGRYREGTIYINSRSENPLAQIFSHELTHSVEMADAYKDLSAIVMNRIRATGGNIQQERQAKAELYAQAGHPLKTQADVDAEIVAEYVEKNLLTNEQSIVSLTQENPGLGRKILNWIDGLLAKLGNKDAQARAFLNKARKIYVRALAQSHAVSGTQTQTTATTANSQAFGETGQQIAGQGSTGSQQGEMSPEQEKAWADEMLRSGQWTDERYDAFYEDYRQRQELEGVEGLSEIGVGYSNRKAEKSTAGDGGEKYSFQGYADDGKGIYKSNFPKGTPKKAKGERILRYIQDVWSKKPITLRIDDENGVRYIEAKFDPTFDESENTRTDASKLMGGNRHGTSAEQRVTLDLADDYYQLVSESKYNGYKEESGKESPTHQGVKMWHYFVNDIYFAEYDSDELVPYTVSINVKERTDGNFIYSFSAERTEKNGELSTQRTLHAAVNSSGEAAANGNLSNKSVPQDKQTVKEQFSISEPVAGEAEQGAEDTGRPEQADIRSTLPAKARNYLAGVEWKLLNDIGEKLGVPPFARKERIGSIIQNAMDGFLRNGTMAEDIATELFDKAYAEGIVHNREEFDSAIDLIAEVMAEEVRIVNRFAKDQQIEPAEEQETKDGTTQDIDKLWQQFKDARKAKEKAVAKNLLTRSDNEKVAELLRGEIRLDQLNSADDNVKGITAVFEAKQEYERLHAQLAEFKRQVKGERLRLADGYLETANDWKDKKSGILYSRETMRRNIYDIIPDKKLAEQINREFFEPVHKSEAQATRFKTECREKVRALGLSTKVWKDKGNVVSEAHAVQLLGEATDNIRVLKKLKGRMSMRDGKNLMEWQAAVSDLWEKNPGLDRAKIESAVAEFRKLYDELFQKMNQVRIANGYEPVNYRQGYFPHFQPEGDSIIAHFGKALGISTQVDTLPTTINGLTHTFKPGIQWFGNAQERLGFNTAYDAVEGFDKYIEGVASVIYQTKNIQKLRAFATQIRYRTSDEGIRKQIDAIEADDSKTEDDKRRAKQEIYENGKYALSNFVNELDEYTNLLANKKSKFDRNMEAKFGRKAYVVMKNVQSRVSMNMIAGNLSSAVTNIIPLTQAWGRIGTANLAKGIGDTLKTVITRDRSMVDMSTFLTNRRGSDPLIKVWYEPVADVLGWPMEIIDNFVSESIVRGAYYQNLKRLSETESMYQADILASSIMADRSKGAMPTLFEEGNPVTKLFTAFQLEVNNQFSELLKDIPREYKDKAKWMLVLCLFKYFLGAFLFNELEEKTKGRRSALDLAGIAMKFAEDVREAGLMEAAGNLIVDTAGSLPFSTLASIPLAAVGVETDSGRVPIASAIPDLNALANAAFNDEWSEERRKATAGEELLKPATLLASPFGGGNQFAKSIKGFLAYKDGGSYGIEDVAHKDEDGNVTHVTGEKYLQYPVYKDDGAGDNFWDVVRAMIYGKSALDEAQEWVENDFNSLSAKHTAVYQDMLDAGVKDSDAYDLIGAVKTAKKTEDKTETEVQRDILRKSEISGDGKALAYYGMVLSETSEAERALMDSLAEAGADMGDVTSVLMDIHDADNGTAGKREALRNSGLQGEEKAEVYYSIILTDNSEAERALMDQLEADGADMGEVASVLMDIHDADALTGAESSCAKRDAIQHSALTEEEKLAIYSEKVSESRVEDYEAFRSAGLDVDDFLETHNAYTRINETDSSATLKATQLSKWVNDQGYTAEQKTVVKDSFAYYNMMPAEATTYEKLVSGGWDSDSAYAVAEAQTRLKKALPNFDENANGRYSQEEVRMAIDAMCVGANEKMYALLGVEDDGLELTNTQKAVIWQMQNKGWKPYNNPYDTNVGQQVYDLLNRE